MIYILHILGTTFGSNMYFCTVCFIISILFFLLGEVKILQYKFRNFTYFTKKYVVKYNLSVLNAQKKLLTECITHHQKIIK